jgi:hypothetical protein
MRKLLFLAIAAVVALSTVTASARGGPVSRVGVNYSGVRNPNGCEIGPDDKHPTELRVKCTSGIGATGPAFVRYRFLRNVGAIRDFATISADIATWIGEDCHAEWMVRHPKKHARTLRITIPFGSYCHIRSVTWSQK